MAPHPLYYPECPYHYIVPGNRGRIHYSPAPVQAMPETRNQTQVTTDGGAEQSNFTIYAARQNHREESVCRIV